MRSASRGGVAAALIGLVLLGSAATATAQACAGDCGGDGRVTIDDLILAVNIALGGPPLSSCAAIDSNGDGTVSIDELVRAVSAALNGCAQTPSASTTASPAGTATVPLAATATAVTATAAPTDTPPPTPSPTTVVTATATDLPPTQTPTATPSETASPSPTPTGPTFCNLPGSLQFTVPGVAQVPGGPADAPSLEFLKLPAGFCAHYYGNVGNVRQLRFAPGGELFAASPTRQTTGFGQNGRNAIVVLPDDDHDGSADAVLTYLAGLNETQGLLFTGGALYYQDGKRIMRVPYRPGDRAATIAGTMLANITVYASDIHWPKTLDAADDGTIYVGNGGDEGEQCRLDGRPFHGGILKLDADAPNGVSQVAKGFRNPISVRCARGYGSCFAIELAHDYSAQLGGREKLVPIRQGDDWGFPCCATRNTPYGDVDPTTDCSAVAQEIDSFVIGHTPFDLDFETQRWPAPWTHRAFVPLHGAFGSWIGARLVAIDFDTMNGQPLPGSDLPGQPTGAMTDFATGWDDGTRSHGRPANVAFAPDGRLFLSNDNTGDIIWIAPFGLPIDGGDS